MESFKGNIHTQTWENHVYTKVFRPKCVSSLLLKTMESQVDRHVRPNNAGGLLYQQAYQTGKFWDSLMENSIGIAKYYNGQRNDFRSVYRYRKNFL